MKVIRTNSIIIQMTFSITHVEQEEMEKFDTRGVNLSFRSIHELNLGCQIENKKFSEDFG